MQATLCVNGQQVDEWLQCTLQDTFQLHWPLINSDHMRYKLAQRELEQKRLDDGNR